MDSVNAKLSERPGFVWQDGRLIGNKDATVHFLSHSLHYGSGVFEGVRAYQTKHGPAVFRLADHTRRLFSSAKIVYLPMPFSQQQIEDAQLEVLAANELDNAYIRPLAMYDCTSLGIDSRNHKVQVFIAAFAWGAYLGKEGLENGIQTGISSYRRHSPNISMCKAKVCGNYINSVLAKREAVDNGFAEALMLDAEGYVAEGSGENLFIVRDGELCTPPADNVLDGITRKTIITLAHDSDIAVHIRRISRDDLYCADEAFFTGTAAEVTPIAGVDRRPIASAGRGPVTKRMQDAYFACVSGKAEKYHHWLSWPQVKQRRKAKRR